MDGGTAEAPADFGVAFLELLLGVLDGLAHAPVLDEAVGRHAQGARAAQLRGRQAHQLIIQAEQEPAGAGPPLAAGTGADLVVEAPCLVAADADHVETAGRLVAASC